MEYKEGDKIETWFSGQPDRMSTILKVQPYAGKYPQYFSVVLTVTAPRTKAGHLEMAA